MKVWIYRVTMKIIWGLYGVCMEFVWSLNGFTTAKLNTDLILSPFYPYSKSIYASYEDLRRDLEGNYPGH
jgi:hypothetical protein